MVECVFVHDAGDSAKFVELCKKAAAIGDRTVIIDTKDVDTAKAAVEAIKDNKPILNGANKDNFAAMNEIATAAGIVLGVHGADLSELHDIVAELEKAGNKNLILDVHRRDHQGNVCKRRSRPPHRHQGRRPHVRLSVDREPRRSVRPQRASRDGACLRVRSEIRLDHRHGQDRLRRGSAALRPAPEHLHRPAEADEGRARHLPDQRRNARRSLRADGRLRADLLPGLRRARALQGAHQPAHHRRIRHVRSDCVGRR